MSPIGPLDDLMWATPDGVRRLVAPTRQAIDYVSGVYGFDQTLVSPLKVTLTGGHLDLHAPELALEIHLRAGRAVGLPWPRPTWFTRVVEAPVARAVLGVRVYGVSASGVREWYRAVSYRRVVDGWASIAGADLGPLRPIDPPTAFGFSEPPRRPSMVGVHPVLARPPRRGPG